jgi:hypothetical protein
MVSFDAMPAAHATVAATAHPGRPDAAARCAAYTVASRQAAISDSVRCVR